MFVLLSRYTIFFDSPSVFHFRTFFSVIFLQNKDHRFHYASAQGRLNNSEALSEGQTQIFASASELLFCKLQRDSLRWESSLPNHKKININFTGTVWWDFRFDWLEFQCLICHFNDFFLYIIYFACTVVILKKSVTGSRDGKKWNRFTVWKERKWPPTTFMPRNNALEKRSQWLKAALILLHREKNRVENLFAPKFDQFFYIGNR